MATTKAALRTQMTAPLASGGRPKLVSGSRSIALLPTLTGKGGKTFRRGGMEFAIASLDEVQKKLDYEIAKAFTRAQGRLENIQTAARSYGVDVQRWISISTSRDTTDRILILTDSKSGQKGALAVELGRGSYYVSKDKNGRTIPAKGQAYKVGAMTGKFILHYGFGVKPGSLEWSGGGRF